MQELNLSLGPLRSELNSNSRVNRYKRATITKAVRSDAYFETKLQMKRFDTAGLWGSAVFCIRVFFKTKRYWDRDNIIRALKPVFDGIEDAGLIINDKDCYHLPPERFLDRDNPRVEVKVINMTGKRLIYFLEDIE